MTTPPPRRPPGKLTATQLKGRDKDQETAENAENPEKHLRIWRKACFRGEKRRSGTDYGSAMHAAMQYIDYQRCGSREEVDREIQRLVSQRFLTEEQGSMVNTGQIAAFFASPLGRRLRTGEKVVREFKFSLLTDAAPYGDGLTRGANAPAGRGRLRPCGAGGHYRCGL